MAFTRIQGLDKLMIFLITSEIASILRQAFLKVVMSAMQITCTQWKWPPILKKVVAMQFVDQTWKHAAMRVHSKLCLLLTEIVSFARKTNL